MNSNLEKITLAAGCFWCTEAVFQRLKGVESVASGYAGNDPQPPVYERVAMGKTGYTEAVQIVFDPTIISLEQLLEVFWALHDPTTLNRQGADVGPQYRSAIFYHTEEQKGIVEKSKNELEQSQKYPDPIVTTIESYTNFYPAEEYNRDFYNQNRTSGYCRYVIDPKIQKLYKDFREVTS
jgi:peptide-methionine (S)-S-oxide reductase